MSTNHESELETLRIRNEALTKKVKRLALENDAISGMFSNQSEFYSSQSEMQLKYIAHLEKRLHEVSEINKVKTDD